MKIGFTIGSASSPQIQLAKTSTAISRALNRLSTGLRVSSPSDDAPAFALGTRLDSQIRGLRMGIQNANEAKGMLETASSALSSQMDLIQRMRELAVQASSG